MRKRQRRPKHTEITKSWINEVPPPPHYDVWEFMHDKLGLTLTESEKTDILTTVMKSYNLKYRKES